jgi:hypothetical protein
MKPILMQSMILFFLTISAASADTSGRPITTSNNPNAILPGVVSTVQTVFPGPCYMVGAIIDAANDTCIINGGPVKGVPSSGDAPPNGIPKI